MTTKPRAKKFRIRRTEPRQSSAATARDASFEEVVPDTAPAAAPEPTPQPRQLNPLEESMLDGVEDGFPADGFATAGQRTVSAFWAAWKLRR